MATKIATPTRAAPIPNARWYPLVNATAVDSPSPINSLLRDADRVASTARPRAPPTCAVVLIRPEANPASPGVAPDIASVMSAGKQRPAPVPSRTITGNPRSTKSPSPAAPAHAAHTPDL